jgi:hypothetical protein
LTSTGDASREAQAFCAALAGVEGISSRLARSALTRGRERFGSAVDELVAAFGRGGLDAVARSEHAGKARALAYFLYTGLLPGENGEESGAIYATGVMGEDDYFESLVWRVVQAHPRGLSGGYFGHWHYPPEDVDAPG